MCQDPCRTQRRQKSARLHPTWDLGWQGTPLPNTVPTLSSPVPPVAAHTRLESFPLAPHFPKAGVSSPALAPPWILNNRACLTAPNEVSRLHALHAWPFACSVTANQGDRFSREQVQGSQEMCPHSRMCKLQS